MVQDLLQLKIKLLEAQNVEITDLDVLYERAKSNQSDYKGFVLESNSMDLSRSLMNIEDNNSVLKNTKTGEILAVDTVETTQLLSEVKKLELTDLLK